MGVLVDVRESTVSLKNSPEELLREFLNDERPESFSGLVALLGGLAYRTAFHTTGDRGLAEEASQRVFVILARKARSLRNHTSLAAWVHRTARYEADKVRKRESAHLRRLQKLTSEQMNEVEESGVLARENWRLLDEAIDRLSPKDRALVMARFFEGKKFRELAAETKSSEAACKVRLRRVMDEMSDWLKGRGCALSVTALASFLGAEWSRAYPPVLLSGSPAILSKAAPQSFLKTLTTMKISKTTAVGLLVLVGGTLFSVLSEKYLFGNGGPSDPELAFSTRSIGKASRSLVDDLPDGEFFGYEQFAEDRLEELYEKYPNLRPCEIELAEGPTVAEHLDLLFKEKSDLVRLPAEINYQLSGKHEWNEELVAAFLEKRRELIDQILAISEYSVLRRKQMYSSSEMISGGIGTMSISSFLRVDFYRSLRAGDRQHADRVMRGCLRVIEAIGDRNVAVSYRGSLAAFLSDCAESGHDVSRYVEKFARKGEVQSIIAEMHTNFADHITLLEQAKQEKKQWLSKEEDLFLFMQELSYVIGGSLGRTSGELYENIRAGGEARALAFHELQEDYARAASGYVESMMEVGDGEVLNRAVFDELNFDLSQYGFSDQQEELVEGVARNEEYGRHVLARKEQSRRKLMTVSALQQAKQAGMTPGSLQELVPQFLPVIPVNAKTGEVFSYNAESGAINFGGDR